MGETIFNLLPDVSGVLLAALGVALVVVPELIGKVHPVVRWVLAGLLVVLGCAGLRSSYVQRRDGEKQRQDSETKQTQLVEQVNSVKSELESSNSMLRSFGPKLDAIISHPESQEQKDLASELRRQLDPKIEIEEPYNTIADPTLFDTTITNTGGSTALGKIDTVKAIIAPVGRDSEEELFRFLRSNEQSGDTKAKDMSVGYAHRITIPIRTPPASPQELNDVQSGKKAVYIGILITYFNESGRQFHSEKCMYLLTQNKNAAYCGSHNKVD